MFFRKKKCYLIYISRLTKYVRPHMGGGEKKFFNIIYFKISLKRIFIFIFFYIFIYYVYNCIIKKYNIYITCLICIIYK